MGKVWALQDAKNRFSEVVDRALQDGPQTVSRHGRNTVVVVAVDDFKRMAKTKGSLVEFMRNSPLKGLGAKLDLERPRDFGRGVKL